MKECSPRRRCEGKGSGHYLNSHCNVWRAQFPDPQVLQHLQEDMRPDPQVQVFPKLLQFYQDLSGRAEILQILREFGQQVKIPSVPRGEDLLGNCWETSLGTSAPRHPASPSPLSPSTTQVMSPGQYQSLPGGPSSLLNVKCPQIRQVFISRASKSWSMICIALKR